VSWEQLVQLGQLAMDHGPAGGGLAVGVGIYFRLGRVAALLDALARRVGVLEHLAGLLPGAE
jgi:hypothetical protein